MASDKYESRYGWMMQELDEIIGVMSRRWAVEDWDDCYMVAIELFKISLDYRSKLPRETHTDPLASEKAMVINLCRLGKFLEAHEYICDVTTFGSPEYNELDELQVAFVEEAHRG